tara:strand:- start:14115 stop:14801 length:687 start_codon:yes stop_codon:yes gene_type:complete
MALEKDPISNEGPQDPYDLLGLEPGASFDEIKKAKEERILELKDDPIKKAKIEAAYDGLLMDSLKSRQLGNISDGAMNASQREKISNNAIGGMGTLITRIRSINSKSTESSTNNLFPSLALPLNEGLTLRIALGVLAFVLMFISSDQSNELILSVSTIGLFVSQIKRGRKPIQALGWSVVLLSIGLIIGGVLFSSTAFHPESSYSLSSQKLEALIALFLLFLGIIFLE